MRATLCAALALAAGLPAAPALAQTRVTILTQTSAGAPSHAQAVECAAVYWVAQSHNKLSEPDRQAMLAWVNHLTTSENKVQADLTPEIRARRDSLSTSLEDPNDP